MFSSLLLSFAIFVDLVNQFKFVVNLSWVSVGEIHVPGMCVKVRVYIIVMYLIYNNLLKLAQ